MLDGSDSVSDTITFNVESFRKNVLRSSDGHFMLLRSRKSAHGVDQIRYSAISKRRVRHENNSTESQSYLLRRFHNAGSRLPYKGRVSSSRSLKTTTERDVDDDVVNIDSELCNTSWPCCIRTAKSICILPSFIHNQPINRVKNAIVSS